MSILGRTRRLPISRFAEQGAYLQSDKLGEILLPRREVPADASEGDWVEAFIFRDSEDRLTATTTRPKVEVGEAAFLEVVDVNEVGAFLDWGLPKDLFVPFAEQYGKMRVGGRHVVTAYIDNTDRIAASSKLDKYLPTTSRGYEDGDEVEILISRKTDLGWESVVDDMVIGLLFFDDAIGSVRPGSRFDGYIKKARPDGKLTLSLTAPGPPGEDLDQRILDHLRASGGESPLNDKAAPEAIFDAFGVSKRVYKRAIGGLYKDKKITISRDKIALVDE